MSTCYRKVSPDIWDDEWFIDQDDAMRDLWFLLITGKQVLPIPGLQNTGPGAIAEKLRRGFGTVSELFRKLIYDGRIQYDERLQVVRVPRAPFHNLPDNPNQVRGWWNAWKRIPNSPLKYDHISSLKEALNRALAEIEDSKRNSFLKAWKDSFGTVPEPFPKGCQTVSDRARASGAGSKEQGYTDTTYQAGAAPPPAGDEPTKPKRKPTQPTLHLDGTDPKPKKPNPVGDTLALYRGPYRERYGCTYTDGGKDADKARELYDKAHTLAAELASDDPDGWRKCLEHWMRAYLANPGSRDYYIEVKHPLRLLDQSINEYGNPWEVAALQPEPEPALEYERDDDDPDPPGQPEPISDERLRGLFAAVMGGDHV